MEAGEGMIQAWFDSRQGAIRQYNRVLYGLTLLKIPFNIKLQH